MSIAIPRAPSEVTLDKVKPIVDVQSSEDNRRIAINKVGIKNSRHPVRVKDRSAGEQHTIAWFKYVREPGESGASLQRYAHVAFRGNS